jgi:hypothetical protein
MSRRIKKMKFKIGDHVISGVMFDVYEFVVIGFDGARGLYQLGWLTGPGSFYAKEDKIRLATEQNKVKYQV